MTDAAPEIGTQFGPYLLTRLIGSGGMGRVFEAQDTAMDRVVALKLISSTYAQNPDYRKRLQREARIAGRLQDPHVVPIHNAGEIDGQLYVDMRLINGTDLDTLLRQTGRMPAQRAVNIARQVASALDAAHAAGVLHRDVKPANILVTDDDFAYLVDFGIANAATEEKLTQMGDVLGTWAYMAPERFSETNDVTPRADVYSLTCVLYEMLTGTPPFGGNRTSVVAAHLSGPIPRPSIAGQIPEALDEVISRGMAKYPAERYATARELARAAEQAVALSPDARNFASAPTTSVPLAGAPNFGASAPTNYATTGSTYQSTGLPTPPHGAPPTTPPGAYYPPQPWPTDPRQQGFTPPPPPPKRRRWIPIAIAAVLAVVVVAGGVGIWQFTRDSGAGDGEAAVADLSTLDTGDYDTQPRDLSGPVSVEEGRMIYSITLAEGMPNPNDVDPSFTYVYGIPASDTAYAATAISGTSTPLTQPAMEKYGMVGGYVMNGYTIPINEVVEGELSDAALVVLVTSYPNPDAATRAAKEMEGIDFDVNPDNRRIDIPDFPDALAHYRPGWSSVAATMPHGHFVVSVVTGSLVESDIDVMVERVRKTLELQVPLLDKVFPQAEAGMTFQERDPNNMLKRAFLIGETPEISIEYAAYGPVGLQLNCASDVEMRRTPFDDAGVDACARTADSQLLRAADEEAATELVPALVESEREVYLKEEIASPEGVPNAGCFEQKDKWWTNDEDYRYYCFLSFDRYVAGVHGSTETAVYQKAAAQYAILVNSQ